ncbi:hypothetical protein [Nocardia sp. NPDC050175]|uniref:hypothetical protein n=1 Tax=Nocardia sp. NPDC050175 TaxID=3364317 RepID=UPI0037A41C61
MLGHPGAERLPELNAEVSLRGPRFDGPRPGWATFWQMAGLGRALSDDADRLAYVVKLTLPAAIGELLGKSHLD